MLKFKRQAGATDTPFTHIADFLRDFSRLPSSLFFGVGKMATLRTTISRLTDRSPPDRFSAFQMGNLVMRNRLQVRLLGTASSQSVAITGALLIVIVFALLAQHRPRRSGPQGGHDLFRFTRRKGANG
jgi:hypothetical protein